MKALFKPTWYVNTIYDISAQQLQAHQIKGMLIDLDNTILPWNILEANEALINWAQKMKEAGIEIYIISNNSFNRVARVADPLQLRFAASALKPFRRKFTRAIEDLKIDRENLVMVGDQIMTDIVGANRNQLKSILVKPLVNHDNIYTLLNRQLERIAMKMVGIDRNQDWGKTLD